MLFGCKFVISRQVIHVIVETLCQEMGAEQYKALGGNDRIHIMVGNWFRVRVRVSYIILENSLTLF